MNVLIISQYFWPENFKINELASFLSKNYNVTVLTGWPNYPTGEIYQEFLSSKNLFNKYYDVEIVRVKIFPRKNNKFFLLLNYLSYCVNSIIFGYWKIRKYKFDLIIVYQPSPITVAIPALFYKFIFKSKMITWILDIWPDTLEAINAIKPKFLLSGIVMFLRLFVKFYYSKNDLLFVQAESAKKIILKSFKNKKKIKTLYSWDSLNYNRIQQPIIKIDQNIFNKDKLKILFTGNIGIAQDFESLIAVVEKLNINYSEEINWIIVGKGSRYEWLKKIIIQKNIKNFYVMGNFEYKYMTWFYKNSDLLMINLKNSDLFKHLIPAKIQSYLAAKKPIIGMISGEVNNIINDNNAGIINEAGDILKFETTVVKFLKMKAEEKEYYSQNAFKLYKKMFDKEKNLNQFLSSIKQI